MKKYFSVVLMALCSLTACAKEQVITFDQVPEPAKAIVLMLRWTEACWT